MVRYAILAASLCVVACEKKPETDPAPAAAAAPSAAGATGAGATGAAAATAGAAAPAGQAKTGTVGAAVPPGGAVVAANNHGKVLVNDAGVVTARRADGDNVVVAPNGVTTANGVVVDPKKGSVVVPGVGTFATPPQ